MIKRRLCRWMALMLALLLCMLPVQALADESYDALVNEWMLTLYDQEQMFAAMDWALDYVGAFCESRDWTALMYARLAVTAAMEEISLVKFDSPEMTAEDYLPFLLQGQDFLHVMDQFGLMEQERMSMLLDLSTLQKMLIDNPYWKYDMEYLQSWLANKRALLKYDMMDLGNACNYIALIAGSDAERAMVREFYQSSCPTIFDAYNGWMEDEQILTLLQAEGDVEEGFFILWQEDEASSDQLASVILDCYDLNISAFVEGQAGADENLNTHIRAAESGDWSEVLADRMEIAGLPCRLPDPGWYDMGISWAHYWLDSEDELILPAVGEEIIAEPAGSLSVYSGVSREAFDDYIAGLQIWTDSGLLDVELEEVENTESGRTVYCLWENAGASLNWAEDDAVISSIGSVAFVPYWYLLA